MYVSLEQPYLISTILSIPKKGLYAGKLHTKTVHIWLISEQRETHCTYIFYALDEAAILMLSK